MEAADATTLRAVRGLGVGESWSGDRPDARRRLIAGPSICVDLAVSRRRGSPRGPGSVVSVHATSSNPAPGPGRVHAAAHSSNGAYGRTADQDQRGASRGRAPGFLGSWAKPAQPRLSEPGEFMSARPVRVGGATTPRSVRDGYAGGGSCQPR